MTLRPQKKPSGKWCLPDATLKRFMTGPLRKQSKGWRFRLAKPGFYENEASPWAAFTGDLSQRDRAAAAHPALTGERAIIFADRCYGDYEEA